MKCTKMYQIMTFLCTGTYKLAPPRPTERDSQLGLLCVSLCSNHMACDKHQDTGGGAEKEPCLL